jgi:HSP20 family molecular chaperone IbpA
VPGAKRDDINVEVRDSELSITGEIKARERKGCSAGAPGVPAGSTIA